MKITISIDIDTGKLRTFTNEHLSDLWHVAQANPAPISDMTAGELADEIGREIIRRWLKENPGNMYHHMGSHGYWSILVDHGKWIGGIWTPGLPARQVTTG